MGKNYFDGIEEAEGSSKSKYVLDGAHAFDIQVVKLNVSKQDSDKVHFISELKCTKTNNPEMRVGDIYATVLPIAGVPKQRRDLALADVKGFLAAALGVEQDEITATQAAEIAEDEDNPLEGTSVECFATTFNTKSGHPFTKCEWSSAETASEEDAAPVKRKAATR